MFTNMGWLQDFSIPTSDTLSALLPILDATVQSSSESVEEYDTSAVSKIHVGLEAAWALLTLVKIVSY